METTIVYHVLWLLEGQEHECSNDGIGRATLSNSKNQVDMAVSLNKGTPI